MPVPERGGVHPALERRLVPPPGHHQPGGPPVGRLEQLEALEAVLVVHRAGPGSEPAGKLVAAVGGHGNRVDPYDCHSPILPVLLESTIPPDRPNVRSQGAGPDSVRVRAGGYPALMAFAG